MARRARGQARWRGRRARWQDWRRSRPFWGGLLLILSGLELCASAQRRCSCTAGQAGHLHRDRRRLRRADRRAAHRGRDRDLGQSRAPPSTGSRESSSASRPSPPPTSAASSSACCSPSSAGRSGSPGRRSPPAARAGRGMSTLAPTRAESAALREAAARDGRAARRLAAALVGVRRGPASADAQAAPPTPSQSCILGLICIPVLRHPDVPDHRRHTDVNSDVNADAHAVVEPAVGQPNGRGADPKPRAQPAAAATVGGTPLSGRAARAPAIAGGLSDRQPVRHRRRSTKNAADPPGWSLPMSRGAHCRNGEHQRVPLRGQRERADRGGGTHQMMEFTADSIDLPAPSPRVTEDGTTATTVSATQFSASGVTLYATKLSGSLQAVSGCRGPADLHPVDDQSPACSSCRTSASSSWRTSSRAPSPSR